MIMHLALVTEEDYPALKCICDRSVTGDSYEDYVNRLLERRNGLKKLGLDVRLVPISPDAFVAQFEERRKATWPDLMQYTRIAYGGGSRSAAADLRSNSAL
jgi:hypothetical protein